MAKQKHKSKRKREENKPKSSEELHKEFKEKYNSLIGIPPAASDDIDRLPKPHNTNCHHLYIFYLKKGVRDETNRIWCQDENAAKGLKWSTERVVRTKRFLVKKEFIEVEQEHDKETGYFGKAYVVLKYYPNKSTIKNTEFLIDLERCEDLLKQIQQAQAEIINMKTELRDIKKEA